MVYNSNSLSRSSGQEERSQVAGRGRGVVLLGMSCQIEHFHKTQCYNYFCYSVFEATCCVIVFVRDKQKISTRKKTFSLFNQIIYLQETKHDTTFIDSKSLKIGGSTISFPVTISGWLWSPATLLILFWKIFVRE